CYHIHKLTRPDRPVFKSTGSEEATMSALTIKRIIVWVVSLALGFTITAVFVTAILPWMGPNNGNPISIERYGIQYFFWTAFPLSLIFVVWLDYFLDTRILPD
ncbi:MAG: alkaline shock response membrane anchor protein AmaP, partial [Anaerolinea sp.]|nr:alkaline shock response membrane anchor protein AmaP [Anaerolinea sp.]